MSPDTAAGQRAFARALLDPACPVPPGLVAWNGSDPGRRFAVHRNNVVLALVGALGEAFPVVRRLVGEDFFVAMAGLHVRAHPPRSPVMADYGAQFADWLAGFEPARTLPWLPDLARLERLRVRAFHAADAAPLPVGALAAALAEPATLAGLRLALLPSLAVLQSPQAVVSLWAAHQQDDERAIAALRSDLRMDQAQAAIVLRPHDEVLVLPVAPCTADFVTRLAEGLPLGEAVARSPELDLAGALGLLIRHGAFAAPPPTGEPA